ncbi:MAG: hypothetical protein ACT4PX_02680 [Actinomycetota bacterium]
MFLVPGLLGAAALARRDIVPEAAVLLTAIAVSSALGYAVFWLYLGDERVGRTVSIGVCVASAAALVGRGTVRSLWRVVMSPAVSVPLALLFLIALSYNGLLISQGSHASVEQRANVQLTSGVGLPVDNDLPRLFADHVYEGTDPRELYGDWRSSDRPPLQTGVVLVQLPVAAAFGIEKLHYQLLASVLQCSWVAAIWALCAVSGFHRRATALALTVAACSGFFLVNSLYVWPKLFAASLVLLGYVLLVDRRPSWPAASMAALAIGLGLLAHAGVVFTLVPVAAVVVVRRTRPPLVPALAGAAVMIVMLGPWWSYARFYDPPGNRLAKWHLAGVMPIDDRSFSRTLIDSYGAIEPSEIVRNKVENLAYVVRPMPRWSELRQRGVEPIRDHEFFVISWALGPLNAGWLALAAGLFLHRRKAPAQWRGAVHMLGVALLAILVWALMMFGPGTTQIHQGSYATMILLWVGLAGVVGTWPRWCSAALAVVQLGYFMAVWVRNLPGPDGPVHLGDAAVAGVAGLLALAMLWRVATSDPPAQVEPVAPGPEEADPPAHSEALVPSRRTAGDADAGDRPDDPATPE